MIPLFYRKRKETFYVQPLLGFTKWTALGVFFNMSPESFEDKIDKWVDSKLFKYRVKLSNFTYRIKFELGLSRGYIIFQDGSIKRW